MSGRILPHDAALPQLGELFDCERMSVRLAPYLATRLPAGWRVESCGIERTKYRPGRNCVMAYRLLVRHPTRDVSRGHRVCVAMYARGEGERRFAAAREQFTLDGAVGWIPELELVIWMFPFDRKLPALPRLADSAWLRNEQLPRLVAARFGDDWEIMGLRSEIVSWFPEHSCTVRTRSRLRHRRSLLTRVWTLYGKTRYDGGGGQCFETMRQLFQTLPERGGDVGYARPIAYDAQDCVLWQEEIAAPTLDRVLSDGHMSATQWTRVVAALASLHRTPLQSSQGAVERAAPVDLAANLLRAAKAVTGAQPSSASAVQELHRLLRARTTDLSEPLTATVHGDLHSRNVLIGADRVSFIDFDRVGGGDPIAELASLLAELVTRDCIAGTATDPQRLQFLTREYAARVPWSVRDADLEWHVAAALLHERAWRCVTSLKPGRFEALPRILGAAHDLLRHGFGEDRRPRPAHAARHAVEA